MARNQSELPICPVAHVYASMVELFLKDGTLHLELANLWFAIPSHIRQRVASGVPYAAPNESVCQGVRRWRRETASRIRAWYAP